MHDSRVTAILEEVTHRLARERTIKAAIAGTFIASVAALIGIIGLFAGPGWALALTLVWTTAAAWTASRFLVLRSRDGEAASSLDSTLQLQDRFASFEYLKDSTDNVEIKKRALIEDQLTKLLPASLDVPSLFPLKLGRSWTAAIALLFPLWIACYFIWSALPKAVVSPLEEKSEKVAEFLEAHPEVPEELRQDLEHLRNLYRQDTQPSQSEIQAAIDKALSTASAIESTDTSKTVEAEASHLAREAGPSASPQATGAVKNYEKADLSKTADVPPTPTPTSTPTKTPVPVPTTTSPPKAPKEQKKEESKKEEKSESSEDPSKKQDQKDGGGGASSNEQGASEKKDKQKNSESGGSNEKGDGKGDSGSSQNDSQNSGQESQGSSKGGKGESEGKERGEQGDGTGDRADKAQQGQGTEKQDAPENKGDDKGIEATRDLLKNLSGQGGAEGQESQQSPGTKDGEKQSSAGKDKGDQGENKEDSQQSGKDKQGDSQNPDAQGDEKARQNPRKEAQDRGSPSDKEGKDKEQKEGSQSKGQSKDDTGQSPSTGERAPQLDKNAKLTDPNLGQGDPGKFEGPKGFRDQKIEDPLEQYDPRFTGQDATRVLNTAPSEPKTSLADVVLAKPSNQKERQEQLIPPEYGNVLKKR